MQKLLELLSSGPKDKKSFDGSAVVGLLLPMDADDHFGCDYMLQSSRACCLVGPVT